MENIAHSAITEKEDSEKMISELESIAQAIIQGKENMTIGIKKMQNDSEARDRERRVGMSCAEITTREPASVDLGEYYFFLP